MADFPIMLHLRGRPVVIIGGGSVALRRAQTLRHAGAALTLIAPQVHPDLRSLGLTIHERPYRKGDLDGALLAILATDDPATNAAAAEEAQERGILINRADDPEAGHFTVPAHRHLGPITLAVHTSGISPRAAATIRDHLLDALDPAWVTLLETIEPFREKARQTLTDPELRRRFLLQLTTPETLDLLHVQGPDALRAHCQRLLDQHTMSKPTPEQDRP